MAKKYYRVTISGRGGEMCFGRLTEDQFDFWAPIEEENIIAHAMWDPYEESDENPLHDEFDNRFIGYWYECDDIAHENGADKDNAWIQVEQYDSPAYDSNYVGDIVDTCEWKDFVAKHNPQVDESTLDLDEELYPNGHYEEGDNEGEPIPNEDGSVPLPYVFFGMSYEKGTFQECNIETDDEIDLTKLRFSISHMPNGDAILNLQEYDNDMVDDQGGSTEGKGYYAEVWDW